MATPIFELGLAIAWLAVGLIFYAALFDRAVFAGRGLTRAACFGPTDAVIAAGLATLFGWIIVSGFRASSGKPMPAPLRDSDMIQSVIINTLLFGTLMLGLLMSLLVRRIPWSDTFGARRLTSAGVLSRATTALVLAAPLVMGALVFFQFVSGSTGEGSEQEVVRFFKESASAGAKAAVAISAMLLAPVQEEFIFRGYLYPVMKRYGGVAAATVLNAALFAGIHLHLPSFPALFTLAVCLTLAYEWTGCLFVPMAMHALFNAFNVAQMV